MALDFCGTLKNIEDSCIAKHATNWVFQRVAVTAMYLQRTVGISPGNTCGQQFGHSSLYITAPIGIFFACGGISQLACDHSFNSHPREFTRNPREFINWFAKLDAVLSVCNAELHGILRHSDGTCCCLDAGGFKCCHQLFEALTFFPT